jgi:hypothetical protein
VAFHIDDLGRKGYIVSSNMPANEYMSRFKWSVAVEQTIAVPSQRLWDVISTPGNLELCHPFCSSNPVKVWPGPESRDAVHYLSGWFLERRFVHWFEGVGYDLEIGRPDGRRSFVSWRIDPIDDQNCTLRIIVYPHILQRIPLVIRWLPHMLRVRPMLRKYLQSVVGGFEWYVTRGEPVPRNNFGSHPWFSGPT